MNYSENKEEIIEEFLKKMESIKDDYVKNYGMNGNQVFYLMTNLAVNTLVSCCASLDNKKEAMQFISRVYETIAETINEHKELIDIFKNKEN